MYLIYSKPDFENNCEYFINEFLKSESVESYEQWIDIYKTINNCSQDTAEKRLNFSLNVFIKSSELECVKYIESFTKMMNDTSCLALNVTTKNFEYIKSIKSELNDNCLIIKKIGYDNELGLLLVQFKNSDVNISKTYKSFSTEGDTQLTILNNNKDVITSDSLTSKFVSLWNNDKLSVPFFDKAGLSILKN